MRCVAVLCAVTCLVDLAYSLVLKKTDPTDDASAQEEEVAKEYMDEWRDKGWEDAKKSCDLQKLPATTDAVIFKVCGHDTKRDKCVCNIAKAHSCHVGCRELKPVCPTQCSDKHCWWGDSSNGGVPLSGGHSGVCHKYCSESFKNHGHRFCGVGPDYQSGLFVDCTNCNPVNSQKANSQAGRKEQWVSCMANCFPTPTCKKMCEAGTPECYAKCVEKYRGVVEPYWDVFKGSLRSVPILSTSTAFANHTQNGTANEVVVDPIEEVVVEEVIEEVPDEEPEKAPVNDDVVSDDGTVKEDNVEDASEVERTPLVKKDKAVEEVAPPKEEKAVAKEEEMPPSKEEKAVEEIAPGEEPWEDPWAGENEWDDEDYGSYDEEPWEDPWAGENEWDEEGYGDWHLVGVRRVSANQTLGRRGKSNRTLLRGARGNSSFLRRRLRRVRLTGKHSLSGKRSLPRRRLQRGDRQATSTTREGSSHLLLRKWRRILSAKGNRSSANQKRRLRRKLARRLRGRHTHAADVLKKAEALGLT